MAKTRTKWLRLGEDQLKLLAKLVLVRLIGVDKGIGARIGDKKLLFECPDGDDFDVLALFDGHDLCAYLCCPVEGDVDDAEAPIFVDGRSDRAYELDLLTVLEPGFGLEYVAGVIADALAEGLDTPEG